MTPHYRSWTPPVARKGWSDRWAAVWPYIKDVFGLLAVFVIAALACWVPQ